MNIMMRSTCRLCFCSILLNCLEMMKERTELCGLPSWHLRLQRSDRVLTLYKNGFCEITQLLSRPKVSKSHCVMSQEPFFQVENPFLPGCELTDSTTSFAIPERRRRDSNMPCSFSFLWAESAKHTRNEMTFRSLVAQAIDEEICSRAIEP